MRKSWPYLLLLVGVMALIGYISQKSAKKRLNWEASYRTDSKIPYGCYVTTRFLESTMEDSLTFVNRSAYQQLDADTNVTGKNYVFINDYFNATAQDAIALCRFVSKGNTVFIAAGTFGLLADTLRFVVDDPLMSQFANDSTLNQVMQYSGDTVKMNLINEDLMVHPAPAYERSYVSYAFFRLRGRNTTILGVDRTGYPNFIRIKMGEGQFLLHCMPEVFTNFYAARRVHSRYVLGAFSYLPKQTTFVDEYYKVGKLMQDDTRRFVMSQPALKLAYYVLIIAGTVALLFGGKRRQRPVPTYTGLRNTTLDFVEQVGALYYRQSDHTNIVQKKIAYFLESVRSRFMVSTIEVDERLIERVTALSGVPWQQVNHLFSMINHMKTYSGHTDRDLKALEAEIREFNKRSKR
jgi:hypothetical protein